MKRILAISFVLSCVIVWISSCQQKPTVFSVLPSSKTGIEFSNNLEKKHLFSILYYLYYYNGGGVSTGDINNDGLPDIYFTANSKGHNKLYLNKGNMTFEDITDKAGVQGISDWCSGSTMADVNGDGWLDIYVSSVSNKYGLTGHNQLFINNKDNTFTDRSVAYGLNTSTFTTQSVFFDYDHDGDLDCYILNQSHQPNANIVPASNRTRPDSLSGDRLYRNDLAGIGRFTDVSVEAGIYQGNLGYGLGVSIADFNNDGWEDIYVGNDFHENDYYYINQKNGKFVDEGDRHFGHYSRFSMGNDAADFNNDGMIDIITVDMLPPDEKTLKTYGSDENWDIYNLKLTGNGYQDQVSRNCLQMNNKNGAYFSDVALQAGVYATDWSWCPLMADFDNDGKKDLFISSGIMKRPVDLDYVRFASDLKAKGMDATDKFDDQAINAMPDGAVHPFFFKGDGGLGFKEISKDWGTGGLRGYYNGSAYADLDNDGDLDMVINALNAPSFILENNAPKKNFLSLSFKGDSLNTTGIGAKAWVFSQNGMQFQQLMLTRGFQSSSDTRLHFGLDSLAKVDSILVVWPDQRFEVKRQVAVNQRLSFEQKNASGAFDASSFFKPAGDLYQDVSNQVALGWQHRENGFVDFNIQYLIPHKQSTRGPRMAVADVNKDGLDDFYVCGAKGQPGAMMIQQPGGHFTSIDTALFQVFAVCDEVDAEFFDANGDGYLDLWTVSGGNEMPANENASADHLYFNDGTGHFKIASGAIPFLTESKSCVTTADIDKDGDMDVFVGFLADIRKYGIPQSSYLYLNDGKGKFSVAPTATMNLLKIGIVTDAQFADLNKDGWPDLIVSGEWMPVKVYLNNKGKFEGTDLAGSSGLWQRLLVADVNGDGNLDFLAGNWGHNSKLWSGKNGPVKLYTKDYDNNGSFEQIMCYTVDGKQYTFLAKDELERALPVLKKAYLSYSEVAGKDVKYVFYDLFKNYTEGTAEVLGSSCFFGDGKGGFNRVDLPASLQLAPMMAIQQDPTATKPTFVAGGNFYGVLPYEGRYDAMLPSQFSYDSRTGSFEVTTIAPVRGEVRDVKWIKSDRNYLLGIARNNEPISFLNKN